jgi:ribosomal protein L11 methyltransferase
VLDYGCGSGILAIAAALHGAAGVDAVDIDPAAVQARRTTPPPTRGAARRPAGTGAGRLRHRAGQHLATPLKVLAPLLAAHVAPGGALVLAGVLERQTDELRQAYRSWLALEVADTEDGWVLLVARRP